MSKKVKIVHAILLRDGKDGLEAYLAYKKKPKKKHKVSGYGGFPDLWVTYGGLVIDENRSLRQVAISELEYSTGVRTEFQVMSLLIEDIFSHEIKVNGESVEYEFDYKTFVPALGDLYPTRSDTYEFSTMEWRNIDSMLQMSDNLVAEEWYTPRLQVAGSLAPRLEIALRHLQQFSNFSEVVANITAPLAA